MCSVFLLCDVITLCSCCCLHQGPFLVSMMGRRKKCESVVTWAQGDPAEVTLTISNPLPFELRVEKMVSVRVVILECLKKEGKKHEGG